jgi:hypothetical protein
MKYLAAQPAAGRFFTHCIRQAQQSNNKEMMWKEATQVSFNLLAPEFYI